MADFCGAFPVLPGKREAMRKFAQEVSNRREDFVTSLKRQGASREQWFLQESDDGDLVLVYFTADDVEAAFGGFAASTDPFDVWQKKQFLEICGIDLTQPGPPPPQVIFDSAG